MNVIARNLSRDNLNLMFNRNLSENVPCTNCYLTCQYPFSVFWNPYQMNFEICLCMSTEFIKSHSDNIIFSSPKGEGFPLFPIETLNREVQWKLIQDYVIIGIYVDHVHIHIVKNRNM